MNKAWLSGVKAACVGAGMFYVPASFSLLLSRQSEELALVWFANVIVGFLLVGRERAQVLGLLFGAAVGNVMADYPFSQDLGKSLLFVPGNMIELLLVGYFLQYRRQFSKSFTSIAEFLRGYLYACVLPSIVGALIGATTLYVQFGLEPKSVFYTWLIGSILASVIVYPLGLLFLSRGWKRELAYILEPKSFSLVVMSALSVFLIVDNFVHPFVYISCLLSVVAALAKFRNYMLLNAVVGSLCLVVISGGFIDADGNDPVHAFYLPLLLSLVPGVIVSVSMKQVKALLASAKYSKEEYERLYQSTPVASHSINSDGVIVAVSNRWLEMLGYRREDVLGKRSIDFLSEESAARAKNELLPAFFRSGEVRDEKLSCVCHDGSVKEVELSSILDHGPGNQELRSYAILKDVSEESRLRRSLENERDLMEVTLKSIGDGVVATDEFGTITFVNDAAATMLAKPALECIGRAFSDVVHIFDQHTGKILENPTRRVLEEKRILGLPENSSLKNCNGDVFSIQDSIAPIMDSDGNMHGCVMVFQDVTEARQISERMSYLAQHDVLTDLPNRVLLLDRLQNECLRTERYHEHFSLLFIDLDNFKNINDSKGHETGDAILRMVAQRLKASVRESDTVSRIGGDEFILMLPGMGAENAISGFCKKIIAELSRDYYHQGKQYNVGASIGVAVCPDDGADAETLLRRADSAMYSAKNSGRNNFRFYSKSIEERLENKLRLERFVRDALSEDRIFPHYQPIVNASDRSVKYFEALFRAEGVADIGVGVEEIIQAAEDARIITELGYLFFDKVCFHIKSFSGYVNPDFRISVNFSASQLMAPGFSSIIRTKLETYHIPGARFIFEITESTFMGDWKGCAQVLNSLRNMGIRIALDDFGTGYSSLSFLKKLPIDILKIDKSFTADMSKDSGSLTFVKAIVEMAEALEMDVVAEGVEEQLEVELYSSLGVTDLQGYHFSKPIPLNKALNYLQSDVQRESKLISVKFGSQSGDD